MRTILTAYSPSFWLSERWKSFLTVTGMALGITLFCGIQVANDAALSSFEDSAALLRGGAELEITASGGELAESIISEVRDLAGVRAAEPASRRVVEGIAGNRSLGPIEVLGVNLLGVAGSGPLSSGKGAPSRPEVMTVVKEGDTGLLSLELERALAGNELSLLIDGAPVKIRRAGALPDSPLTRGRRILVDIASFQDLFHSWGYLDSLQVFLAPEAEREAVERVLDARLGPRFRVSAENRNARHAATMTAAFRLNLQFLSSISLFVALLLVYQTMSFFVLKRRRDFAVLQTLGVPPRALRKLLFGEALILGTIASALGLLFGAVLSRSSLGLINVTLQNVYGQLSPASSSLSLQTVVLTLLLGPALAVLGALGPSQEVLSVSLREAFSYQTLEQRFRRRLTPFAIAGIVFLALCIVSARPEVLAADVRFGFLSPAFAVFSACLLVPWALDRTLVLLRRMLGERSLPVLLASDHVLSTPRRNSVAVASVGVALAMALSLTVMIASFRDTVSQWITAVTKADIFISGSLGPTNALGGSFQRGLLDRLASLPGVREYDFIENQPLDWNGRRIRVSGCRMELLSTTDRLLLLRPMSAAERDQAAHAPDTVLVSEVFARRTGKNIGDAITIPGRTDFHGRVTNIFYDYSSDQGVVLIPAAAFESLFGPKPIQGISLYLTDPSKTSETVERIRTELASSRLNIRDNVSLRREVLRVFDDTFRITYVLQFIALLVSAGTLMNTLSMLALERTKEFAVFRAIGAAGKDIISMVTAESLLLTAAGLGTGLVLGLVLAILLVFVVNAHFFGWSIGFHLPFGAIVAGAFVTLLTGFLVGRLQGRRLLSVSGGVSLRYE